MANEFLVQHHTIYYVFYTHNFLFPHLHKWKFALDVRKYGGFWITSITPWKKREREKILCEELK